MKKRKKISKDKFKITIQPTYKQKLCWQKLRDSTTQFILFGGGAGGGKSWIGCEWLLLNCLVYPGSKWFMGRNELKRLKGSTYQTFLKVCRLHSIPKTCWKLNSQESYILFWNGSRIDLIDVAYQPSDPLYERFGSMEFTGGWLEEVGEIRGDAFDILKSRIGRHANDEFNLFPKIFLTCNPKKNWVYFDFYKPWKENRLPEDTCFIQSLYNDNPYTAKTYGETLSKLKSNVTKQRLMYGLWEYEDDDAVMMEYEKILAMFDREQTPNTNDKFYLTVDVARYGRDRAVFILWQGWYIRKVWFYDKSSTQFIEEKIISVCDKWHIPRCNVIIDQDGVGGGVVDHLPGVYAFVNAGRPIEEWDDNKKWREQDTDRFAYKNLRSQCYDRLADYINEGLIGCYKEIPINIRDWIVEELESIRRKDVEDNEKKFQVISKEEIKQDILGRSPDFADAMMMRCVFGLGNMRETVKNSGESFEIDVVW